MFIWSKYTARKFISYNVNRTRVKKISLFCRYRKSENTSIFSTVIHFKTTQLIINKTFCIYFKYTMMSNLDIFLEKKKLCISFGIFNLFILISARNGKRSRKFSGCTNMYVHVCTFISDEPARAVSATLAVPAINPNANEYVLALTYTCD